MQLLYNFRTSLKLKDYLNFNLLICRVLIIFGTMNTMTVQPLSDKNTRAYKNYNRVLPFFRELIFNPENSVSDYWSEEINGFEYIFEASPSIINNLRHHCYHITGEFPYGYRNHHNFNTGKFKSKLDLLNSIIEKDILIPEPSILGGFGHKIYGKLINKDTLKYFESLIALEKTGILNELNKNETPVICEIGAGWGGFTHCLSETINKAKFVIVDLPETLIFSYIYLSELYPDKTIKLYDFETTSINDCDFLLIPGDRFEEYSNGLDLTVNLCSFQEMTSPQVEKYIKKVSEQNSKFIYSLNRDLNKNNSLLKKPVSEIISSNYEIDHIELLNISYTDINSLNNKVSYIKIIKNIVKKLLRKPNEKSNFDYQHIFGKIN